MTGTTSEVEELTIGSLCSGYGGLTLAVQAVLGGRVAWHSEFDEAPSKVLNHRFPGVPNLGDMTVINWSATEPVTVLEGGTPCQDVSHAGPRTGMRAGTRSGLWSAMADATEVLRPRLVVWENVRGVLSAGADSGLESCPVCVGDGQRPALRALGRVLGDLADLGYDARWCGLPASAVGAPHPRYRVFVVAQDADQSARGERWFAAPGEAEGGRAWSDAGRRDRAPVADTDCDAVREQPVAVAGSSGQAVALQPCPDAAADSSPRDADRCGSANTAWGAYEPAIRRWEAVTRPAPAPTVPGRSGGVLAPAFVEWMMGLPPGWVTDVPDLSRNDQLKILGNGVVPQQGAAALRYLLDLT